jgi:dTDP-4-dehydrorhamnose 3,5-epimerase
MDKVDLILLDKMSNEKGSVFHIIKEPSFEIKEVYLSSLGKKVVKGWKKHKSMTLNLVVIKGDVLFTIISGGNIFKYTIGDSNYCRLVIPPMSWVCFEGIEDENIIINCADMVHDPDEIDLKEFNGYEEDFSNWI